MSVDLFFAVPLVVQEIEPAMREAIGAKVAAYLKTDGAKRDIARAPEESVATSYYRPEASILADAELEELEAVVIDTAKAYLEGTLKLPPRRLPCHRKHPSGYAPACGFPRQETSGPIAPPFESR